MDIVTYVLSKAYADKKSSELSSGLTDTIDSIQAELTAFKNAMASGMLYKGSVDTLDTLPTSDNKIGDVYTVKEDQGEYVWTGSEWFPLGEDLTEEFEAKQDKLTAGTNISIADDSTISSREEIVMLASLDAFPAEGQSNTIYVSKEDLQMYVWDEDTQGYTTTKVDLTSVISNSEYILDGGTATLI